MDEAVAVRDLARRFGDRAAVDGVSLAVAEGELHALVGPNGAGKTTLMRMLAGLLPCDRGEGTVLGLDLLQRQREVARAVGYVAQKAALHADLTVEETLRFRATVYAVPDGAARIAELIARFDLGRFRRARAGLLSGGWARRLQLAAGLVHRPRLLLLDEPAAGLDHAAQRFLWREIAAAAAEGVAVIVNTHDPAEAERCDRVSVMAAGRLRAQGTPAALVAESRLAVFTAPRAESLPGPWATGAERWGAGLRYVVPSGQAAALEAAAHGAGVALSPMETRLEHAWPMLVDDAAEAA